MTAHHPAITYPPPPPRELTLTETSRATIAALHARRMFPGPAGAVLSRVIDAYATFGHRVDHTGLMPALIDQLMKDHPRSRAK
jgi:hypothetical protein